MIERSSAWMVRIDPLATLNDRDVLLLPIVELPIAFPSRRTVTRPSILQLPKSSEALPSPQNDVEIVEVVQG